MLTLHVQNFALDVLAGFFVALGGVCIYHVRALFDLTDMSFQFGGLAEGHPDRRYEILTESRHPER